MERERGDTCSEPIGRAVVVRGAESCAAASSE